MEFAPIGPLWSLDKHCAPFKYQMCLAPYCQNAEYLAFYKRMVAEGKHVMLDNGAYENNRLDFVAYRELIEELRPTEYIVPDKIGDDEHTRIMWNEWFRRFGDQPIPGNPGFVQHQHIHPFQVPRPAHFVCFPKHWGRDRIVIAKRFLGLPVHALGFIDEDPLAELPKLAALGVRSVDSSEPIWKGSFDLLTGVAAPEKFRVGLEGASRFIHQLTVQSNLDEVVKLCRPEIETDQHPYPGKVYEIDEEPQAKRDERRPRYDLIPKEWLEALTKVAEEGLRYGEDNWKQGGKEWIRDARNHLFDHLLSYNNGDRSEDHLAKVAWNALAVHYHERKKNANHK